MMASAVSQSSNASATCLRSAFIRAISWRMRAFPLSSAAEWSASACSNKLIEPSRSPVCATINAISRKVDALPGASPRLSHISSDFCHWPNAVSTSPSLARTDARFFNVAAKRAAEVCRRTCRGDHMLVVAESRFHFAQHFFRTRHIRCGAVIVEPFQKRFADGESFDVATLPY